MQISLTMPGIAEFGLSASGGGSKGVNKPLRLHNTLVLEPALSSNSEKKRSFDISKVNVSAVQKPS